MTLTLLLDLDDTLLASGTDQFVTSYLSKLGAFIGRAAGLPAERVIQECLAATRAMQLNCLPDQTLKEVFDWVFYPALGFPEAELRPYVEQFYSEEYPALQKLTQVIPGAKELVDYAFENGWRTAIATNPLFPETAVRQRLEWAGFPSDDYPFDLVGSYEHMHYAKPKPAYFAEILTRLGCPEEPLVMAGNELSEDIAPAQKAGLPGFLVSQDNTSETAVEEAGIHRGTLSDLLDWLKETDPESLCGNYSPVSATLAQMYATPAGLHELVRALPGEIWAVKPAPEEWNLTEIFCHLRDVECDVNIPRLSILEQASNPFIAAQDTDRWAKERGYARQNGRLAMHEFTRARMKVLDRLSEFTDKEWQQGIRHAIFGSTTVQELFCFASTHDRLHVQQAYAITTQIQAGGGNA